MPAVVRSRSIPTDVTASGASCSDVAVRVAETVTFGSVVAVAESGFCCAESGHLEDAKSFYAQALRIAPQHPAGIANLQAVEAELAGRPVVERA